MLKNLNRQVNLDKINIEDYEVKAFVFNQELHDITDQIKNLTNLTKLEKEDQLITMFEYDNEISHFMYYVAK